MVFEFCQHEINFNDLANKVNQLMKVNQMMNRNELSYNFNWHQIESKMSQQMIKYVILLSVVIWLSGACPGQDHDHSGGEAFDLLFDNMLNQKEEEETVVEEISNSTAPHSIQDFFNISNEVDDLIGVDDDTLDQKGNTIPPVDLTNLKQVLNNNKRWAKSKTKFDKEYFSRHSTSQKPQYLWIGCSDSRLPANEILGLDYGEVFVMRNVANIVSPSDISSLAVVQYAVDVLEVKDIIIAGHYGCGGIKAAVRKFDHGPLQAWLSKLRRIRQKHSHAFEKLQTIDEKANLLVEINVKEQVFNVASTSFVQNAWKQNKELRIHGLVFDLDNGRLVDLNLTMYNLNQLPEELLVVEI